MSHGYTAHGEFQPDQVVTLPESKIFSEFEGPAEPDAASPPSESANLSKDRQSPTDLQWHPVAELFPIPGGEEMAEMVADLKTNGLREPGKTWKGIGIDGRFRAAACQRAEVDFRTEEIDLPDEAAVIAYIMSRNIRRRQMSEAQRAMVAARMIPFYSEAAQKRMKAGKKANPKANLPEGEKGAVREVVAKLMNVSSGSVGNAARLLKQGCPELIQQVERGEISVSAATDVSGLSRGQQKKIAERGKKAVKAKAKEIRMNRKPLRLHKPLPTATEFVEAAARGDVQKVERWLRAGANVNSADGAGRTTLMEAAYGGKWEVLEVLVKYGADVNARHEGDYTALMRVVSKGHLELVRLLLEKGADVNAWTDSDWTALMVAAEAGLPDVVRALLEKGADVNAIGDQGKTALMCASEKGHSEVVKLLLDSGADIHETDVFELTALGWAAREGHVSVVETLLSAGANINQEYGAGTTALYEAAAGGHVEVVRVLLANGAAPRLGTHWGETALTVASEHGHTEIEELLRARGADE